MFFLIQQKVKKIPLKLSECIRNVYAYSYYFSLHQYIIWWRNKYNN